MSNAQHLPILNDGKNTITISNVNPRLRVILNKWSVSNTIFTIFNIYVAFREHQCQSEFDLCDDWRCLVEKCSLKSIKMAIFDRFRPEDLKISHFFIRTDIKLSKLIHTYAYSSCFFWSCVRLQRKQTLTHTVSVSENGMKTKFKMQNAPQYITTLRCHDSILSCLKCILSIRNIID